jgi:glycosyltransferase involved in cell wall biosynthesis
LEQSYGNAVHGRNLAEVASSFPGMAAHTVEIRQDMQAWHRKVPVLGNWTLEASWRARRAVVQQRRRSEIDALFIHTQCPAQLLPDMMRRIPTVVSIDATPNGLDDVGEWYGHQRRGRLTERAKNRFTGRAFHAAAALVTWSHWAADSLVRDYGVPREKVHVIYPGVQLDRFRPQRPRASSGVTRLLFVGGDFERKGGPEVLSALERLGPNFVVDIVTSAPVGRVPAGVNVHVGMGPDSADLVDLYDKADIFVLPTRGDTLGLVFAEALACGVPVIACDVGAVSEIVIPGETGLLVPPRSPEQLALAIRSLADQPELRRRMSERGLTMVRELHDAQRNCTQILELLSSVARVKAGARASGAAKVTPLAEVHAIAEESQAGTQ